MNEPLPHFVNIANALQQLGVTSYDEPMMFILGSKLVTADVEARRTVAALTPTLASVNAGKDLDTIAASEFTDAAAAIRAYQEARRILLSTAAQQGLLASQTVNAG